MDTTKIAQKICELSSIIEKNDAKCFLTSSLLERFKEASQQNRYDMVIRSIEEILQKRVKRNSYDTITAEEIGKMYNDLIGFNVNSKFKEIFADLLPVTMTQNLVKQAISRDNAYEIDRNLSEVKNIKVEIDEYDDVSSEIKQRYGKFDKRNIKFSNNIINLACDFVRNVFDSLGYSDVKVNFKTNNDNCILCTAILDTSLGRKQVNVPIEVVQSVPQYPIVFEYCNKVYSCDTKGLNEFLDDIEISEKKNLNTRNYFYDSVRDLSKKSELEVDQFSNLEIEQNKVSLPEDLKDVEAVLINSVLRKESKYNDKIIDTARDVVCSGLRNFGLHGQVSFAGDYQDGVAYNVEVVTKNGKVNFVVPVRVVEGKVTLPTIIKSSLDSDKQFEFSVDGIAKYVENHKDEAVPIKYTSNLIQSTLNELRKVIQQATFEQRYNIVKEAFNVILDKYGNDAFDAAVQDYKQFLTNLNNNDYKERCASCKYLLKPSSKSVHTIDWCHLLNADCKSIVKDKTGHCVKLSMPVDERNDKEYSNLISNKILF